MKKTFTIWCLVLIAFGYTATAQSTRLVLAEEFTQASCPPCASQNPTFNTLLNNNATKVVAIKYQTSWPGVDPMNDQTQTWVGPRVTYYSVTGVPTALMDGVEQTGTSYDGAPANWNISKLNARAAITSPYTLGVSHSFNSTHDSIFITVDIAATGAVTGTLVAHVAVIEREVPFCNAPGTNGETDFEGVMRTMLPNAYGTSLAGSWTVGQTQTLTFAAKVPAYTYDHNQLAVVAFIQDDVSKEVKQAGYSAPQPLSNDAKLVCSSISGIPKLSCGTPLSPVVTFENTGSSNLTALTINYSVDGVAVTPLSWTGNLAPAATGTINLTGLNTSIGSHSLEVSVTSPNNGTDYNVYYDEASINYSVSSSTGGALPLVQAFGSPNFPPPNWIDVNNDNGFGWELAVAGFNGQGSAKIDFYNSPNAQIDALISPNFDFSAPGTTTAQIDFDVAHAQYSSSTTDRLQIMYSLDCGVSWSQPIFNEAGATLATGNPVVGTGAFTPTSTQWHHKTASLTGAVGSANVFIKFNGISNYGNNCYLDNINVSTNLTTGVPVIFSNKDINVYPNPSNGAVKVSIDLTRSHDVTIVVTNALGAIVKTMNLNNVTTGIYDVDLTNEAKGTYEVSVKTDEQIVTKRISITQ